MGNHEPAKALTPSGPLEKRMIELLRKAAPGDHEIVVKGPPREEVRSSFLRWFLLEALPAAGTAIARFELQHAKISGEFD